MNVNDCLANALTSNANKIHNDSYYNINFKTSFMV